MTGDWRVRRSEAFACRTVTARTCGNAPTWIADGEEARRDLSVGRTRWNRKGGVVLRYGRALTRIEALGDPAHLRVTTPAVCEGLELALEIACIQRGQPGRGAAIPRSAQPMAGNAGIRGAGATAAECNQLACRGQTVGRARFELMASGSSHHSDDHERAKEVGHRQNGTGTARSWFPFILPAIAAFASASACKPPPEPVESLAIADAANGKRVIQTVGCASCHTIKGVAWPEGRAAPELRGLVGRAFIAGQLPNDPGTLAAFIRDAPRVAPGTTMPAMPLTEQESRDVAAYLYDIGS